MSDRLHCCCICGKVDFWGDSWSWYGSVRDEDDDLPVAKFCSKECASKAGRNAENVTDEMKAHARRRQDIGRRAMRYPEEVREKWEVLSCIRKVKPNQAK